MKRWTDPFIGVTNVYDAMGRLVAVTNGTIVCLRSNNLAGTLLSERWLGGPLDGWWVTNHFDSLQRRDILQVYSGSTLMMQHDYAFDSASRLTQVWQGSYSAGYTYLANSPLVGQVGFTNNGTGILTTTKQYDLLNRLTTIASVGTGSTPSPISSAYRYNAANQRVQANREDGAYWRYEYDKLGQVVSGKKYWSDGTPVPGMQFEYGFDDIGNRKATAAGGSQSGAGFRPASYNANLLNQYTSRTVPGGFDVLGAASATNAVVVNGSPADYRHGEFFQELITANNTNATIWQSVNVTNTTSGAYETGAVFLAQSPEAFTHDSDGNLTQDGRWDYTWDGENRLIQMETRSAAYTAGAPRQKLVFAYDWQSRRISKTVSNWVSGNWALASTRSFIYDGWNLLAILNPPSSILQQFMWGLDLSGSLQGAGGVGGLVKVYDNTANKHYFPAYDGNGNIMALVDGDTGAETARYEYGPFGEAQVLAGSYALFNPFRFSTKFTDDETAFLYYGYRSYNPLAGRWLSRDPIGERGFRALVSAARQPMRRVNGEDHLYRMVNANAVSNIDPDGTSAVCAVFIGFLGFAQAGLAEAIHWIDTRGWENGTTDPSIVARLREAGFTDEDFDLLDWGLDNTAIGHLLKQHGGPINDKYLHCKTSCEMSRLCGAPQATLILGILNEVADEIWGEGADPWDLAANGVGIGCSLVTIRVLFDCDKCCRCAGYRP